MGVIRLMMLDDVSIGVCLTGWLWFAGKPKVRRLFLCALSVLRSGRFAFGHGTVGLLIQRSAPSGAVAGRFMELRGAYSRSGGGMKRVLPAKVEEGLQCAVWWLLGLVLRGLRAVRASVSWPARLAGLRKRSEAECSAYEGSFPLNSAYRLSGMKA